jgi:DNA invertase Pin-like site-specific DNA recombinase
MRLVAYIRTSTDDQQHGRDAQHDAIRAWAASQKALGIDISIVAKISDSASAGNLDRPGVQRVLAMLRDGRADGIVVTRLDRLTRSLGDFARLQREYFSKGFALMALGDSVDTTTPTGRLVVNVMLSVAEWERERISERTKDALAAARRRGVRLGPKPKKISAAELTIALGPGTLQARANELNKISTARKWFPITVQRVVKAQAKKE